MKEEEKLWKDELDALLGKLLDEDVTVGDEARLNEILQTEPGAREFLKEGTYTIEVMRRQLMGYIQNRMQEDGI
ncbi:hypothetical protein OAK38_03535 [Verrucomicrobia bacterium]|nr:hypothetical protein [Verrucomicrobiota bacterium]